MNIVEPLYRSLHVITLVLLYNKEMFRASSEMHIPCSRNWPIERSLVSWTQSTTSSSQSSKMKVPQVNLVIRPPHDSEKQETCAKPSCNWVSRDLTRNKSPNISCILTHNKSQDLICIGQARSPLIDKWQIIGIIHNQWRHVTPVKG
jgi:hypothetical protein